MKIDYDKIAKRFKKYNLQQSNYTDHFQLLCLAWSLNFDRFGITDYSEKDFLRYVYADSTTREFINNLNVKVLKSKIN